MYGKPNLIKLIFTLNIVVVCIAMIVLLISDLKDSYNEALTANNVKQGIVVDKDIKQTSSLFSTNSQPKYELTLKVTYTYKNETKTKEITKIVDKETYMSTNINDLFDITTLTATATDVE